MNTILPKPEHNLLLASLPPSQLEHLGADCELLTVSVGDVLYETNTVLQYAYFPVSAIVSLNSVTANGSSSEVASVGREGVLGISIFMGGNTLSNRAVVHTAGDVYRLPSSTLIREFHRAGGRRAGILQQLLLRYTQTLMIHIGHTAICNRHHSIEQQLCRWLLLTMDRMASNQLTMTQELIANSIGVRRESISVAASILQQHGIIRCCRGHIQVIDRRQLEARVCECYFAVKQAYERLEPVHDLDQRMQCKEK